MKILHKLVLLAVLGCGLFLASYGITILLLRPLDTIAAEQGILSKVGSASLQFEAMANSLVSAPLSQQAQIFQKARADFDAAFQTMESIRVLPTLNDTLKQAIQAVSSLKAISDSSIQPFQDQVAAIASNEVVRSQSPSQTLFALMSSGLAAGDDELLFALGNYLAFLQIMNDDMNVTLGVLAKQEAVIQAEVDQLRTRAIGTAGASALVLMVLMAVAAVLIARSITRSIRSIETQIGRAAEGDLTVRFALNSKDEIGRLSEHLDRMISAWAQAVNVIQASAHENSEVGDQLNLSVETSTSSAVEIEANSKSIQAQMRRLDEMIGTGTRQMDQVVEAFSSFQSRLQAQNSQIALSVASVDQLEGSVVRIAELTRTDRQAVEALVEEAVAGQAILEDSFDRVTEITESVSQIQDLTQVIADIAGKTNVLALNASIEAAHAGEFGKGFSVVADEITKLAAVSASSSGEIAQVIRAIVEKIEQAASTKDSASVAFQGIRSKIEGISQSLADIFDAVNAMKQGNSAILAHMGALKADSREIAEVSASIVGETAQSRTTMTEVGRISHEVISNLDEIAVGLNMITATIHRVLEDAHRIGVVGRALDQSVDRFKAL